MKKTITKTIKAAMLLLISTCCFNAHAQTPVVYYPLNGNAIDSSGKGLHGRMENCTPIPDRFGRPNGAIQLDNIVNVKNSKITFPTPDVAGFYSDVFTYSLWVKVPSYYSLLKDNDYTIFEMGNTDNSYHWITVNNSSSISDRGFGSGTSNNISDITKAHSYCSQSAAVDSTKWYHLVFVRDTGNTRLYVNGSLKSTTSVHSLKPKYTKGDSTASFNLYKIFGNHTILVDELRIFDKVLTTAQIAALYTPAPATSGIQEKEMPSTSVYPNPSYGIVSINSNQDIANINVYDISGRAVHNQQFTNKLNQTEIDLSALNNGIYFIAVQSSNGEISKSKIVLAK
ncbi:MAG: T9SS C-terminal target domain-containing protein [Bacteroidetes bacterium]|nr:T9SS C-terminal target domain-containing protein [Bacteroidota bacterium]